MTSATLAETPMVQQKIKAKVLPQVLASLAAGMSSLVSGSNVGWIGNTLPSLIKDPELQASGKETAILVASGAVGSLVLSPVASRLLDYFGRRKCLLSVTPVVVVGWIMSALAPNMACIIAAIFLNGVFSVIAILGTMVYLSEIAEARLRGRLASMQMLMYSLGILFGYGLGAALPWRTACHVANVLPILYFILMYAAPESPYWFLLKDREPEAATSMKKLRGQDYDCEPELKEMADKIASIGEVAKVSELLKSRTRKPLLIFLFLHTVQQMCGCIPVLLYIGTIFMETNIDIGSEMATLYTGIVQVVSIIMSLVLVDRLGRKFLFTVSILIVGACMLGLASFFWLRDIHNTYWPKWVSLPLVMGILFGYCIGARSVPVIAAEFFNTKIRTTASSVGLIYNRTINIVALQIYVFLRDGVGMYAPFLLFGIVCFVGSIFTVIIVPETKGKTLEEIQEYFENRSSRKRNKNTDIN
ncbi:trehalose transporter 1-like protein [Oratosquilla oratoria]|uniref:trehalose transporter 1-like protein n=1 Tax=Oratosquilla oratoria TaxID=337810 RepID=UPI003F75FC24